MLERAEWSARITTIIAFSAGAHALGRALTIDAPWRWWWLGARGLSVLFVFACWWYVFGLQRDAEDIGRAPARGCVAGSDLPKLKFRSWFRLIDDDASNRITLLLWLLQMPMLDSRLELSTKSVALWAALQLALVVQLLIDRRAYRALKALGAIGGIRPTVTSERDTIELDLCCPSDLVIDDAHLQAIVNTSQSAASARFDAVEQRHAEQAGQRTFCRRFVAQIPTAVAIRGGRWKLVFSATRAGERATYEVIFDVTATRAK